MSSRPGSSTAGQRPRAFSARPSSSQSADIRILSLKEALKLQQQQHVDGDERLVVKPKSARLGSAGLPPLPKPGASSAPSSAKTRAVAVPTTPAASARVTSGSRGPRRPQSNGGSLAALSTMTLRASHKALSPARDKRAAAASNLGNWPASLPTHAKGEITRAGLAVADALHPETVARQVERTARICTGVSRDLNRVKDVVRGAPDAFQRAADHAVDVYQADGGEMHTALDTDVVAPLLELEEMWCQVRASSVSTAAGLKKQNGELRETLSAFLMDSATSVDRLLRDCEDSNATITAAKRRYNIVHDRQKGAAAVVVGLHEAQAKMESLTKAARQLEAEVKIYEQELERNRIRGERSVAQGEAANRGRTEAVDEMKAQLLSACEDLEFATRTEESLRFRITNETERRDEIARDIERWREKLASGEVAQNEALTPRPNWSSFDVTTWGIPTKQQDVPSDDEDASGSDNGGGEGLTTFQRQRFKRRSRLLTCREGGGAGFASPIAVSTESALNIVARRLRQQTALSREYGDEATTFRRLTATYMGNVAPVAFTFAIAQLGSFLAGKSDLVSIRDGEGLVYPTAPWRAEQLSALSFNFGRSLQRFLSRNPVEDDAYTAATELIDSIGDPLLSAARSRSGSVASTSRRPSMAADIPESQAASVSVRRFSLKAAAQRVKLINAAVSSHSHRNPLDELLSDWPSAVTAMLDHEEDEDSRSLQRRAVTVPALGVDNARRLLSQLRAHGGRASIEGNTVLFALEEVLSGRLSPRLFQQHHLAMEAVVKMYTALSTQEKRPGVLAISLAEAAVRKCMLDSRFAPADAVRIALAAVRNPVAGGVTVPLAGLMHPLSCSVMLHLLDEQKRLHAHLAKLVAGCSYHNPTDSPIPPAAGAAVWLFPGEMHVQTVVAQGIPRDVVDIPTLWARRKALAEARKATSMAEMPALDVSGSPSASGPAPLGVGVLKGTVGLLMEHLFSQLESPRHVSAIFTSVAGPQADVSNDELIPVGGRRRRRTEFNTAALRRFQHAQLGTGDSNRVRRDAENVGLIPAVERYRGRSVKPNPAAISFLLSDLHAEPLDVLESDETTPDTCLVDAAEVLARARGLCLRQYVVGTVTV